VAGLVDTLPPLLCWLAAWRLGLLEIVLLSPADWAFLPEHWGDLYRLEPSAFVLPPAQLGALAILWQGLCLALFDSTPGKRLLGLRVVDERGEALGPGALVLRLLGLALSWLSLGLGWLLGFVLPSRRTLHDLLSDSYVVLRVTLRRELGERGGQGSRQQDGSQGDKA